MHIAVDARELAGRRTGVGRYLDRLLTHWGALPATASHRFTLFAHVPITGDWQLRWTARILPGRGGTRWEQITLAGALRTSGADVLFAPAYTAPLFSGTSFVVAVHDISYVAHPEWFRWRERWRRGLLTRAAARRAHSVLTISEFSKSEIVRRLGVPARLVRVVHPGVGHEGAGRGTAAGGARAPRVLFVGTLLNRRHLPALVRAVGIAARTIPDLELVIAGDNRTWPHEDPEAIARELGLASRVQVRAFVDEDELARLYGSASVFAFLSEYEGFGLTPLEALGAGVPPLVLDTPVAREVYGKAALYVGRPEPDVVAAALIELLTSQASREALLAAAPGVLGRFRWDEAAAATLTVLEEAGHGWPDGASR